MTKDANAPFPSTRILQNSHLWRVHEMVVYLFDFALYPSLHEEPDIVFPPDVLRIAWKCNDPRRVDVIFDGKQ